MSPRVSFGPFVLEPANAILLRDGERVDISPKAFDLLVLLSSRPDRLVTKDEILDEVWGRRFVSESVVKTIVSEMRAALGDDAKAPHWIETVARRGYRFIGKPATVSTSTGQATTAPARSAVTLIGRRDAMQLLNAAWTTTAAGQRRLVFVTGEPGMGKTTLINEFARSLEGAQLALGQCVEHYGSGEPYLPVLEALNVVCNDDPAVLPTVRKVAPTWLVQMPWHLSEADRAALMRDVTGASQDRMLREMGVLLEQLATRRALLLVLEDLHWCDHATVQLLDHLARRRGNARVMVLGTFRPAEVIINEHPIANLRRELRLHRLCEIVQLDGFGDEEVAELIAARFSGAVAEEDFVRALGRHTDGLPLFLATVLEELVEQGVIRRNGGGRWHFPAKTDLRLPVPENLLGLADKQLQRLSAETRRLLEVAALATTDFDHLAVAQALNLDEARVREQFDGLVRRRLWLRDSDSRTLHDGRITQRYTFLHALLRHAFASHASPAAAIDTHRKLSAAIETVHGPRAAEFALELAHHAELGHDPLRAARWYATAAQAAMQRIAPREALALAERGLGVLGKAATGAPNLELPLLAVRIAALMITQGYSVPLLLPSTTRAAELIETQPLSTFTIPLWHMIWWTLHNSGQWDRAATLVTRFVALSADASAAAQAGAHNVAGIAALFAHRYDQAIAELRRSLDAQARYTDDDRQVPFVHDMRVEALAHLCVAFEACGRFAEAATARADIERRYGEGVDPLSEIMGLWYMTCCAHYRQDARAMLAYGERAMAIMSSRDALPGAGPHRVSRGWARVMTGDVTGGLEEARSGLEHYQRQGSVMGMLWQAAVLAEVCLRSGDLAGAESAMTIAIEHGAATELSYNRPYAYLVNGMLLGAKRNEEAAARELELGISMARDCGARLMELLALTELVRQQGTAATKKQLSDLLAAMEKGVDCPALREARGLVA